MFTLPNLLSALRLGLIGVIVWLYAVRDNGAAAAAALLLSGLTDIVDGRLARRLGQVSNLGKALDPLADKLTQLAVSVCLLRRYRVFLLLCALLCLKETTVGLCSLAVIARTGQVRSARWHGKAATTLMVLTTALHFLWGDVPDRLSWALAGLCAGAIVFSGALYVIENVRVVRGERT